MVHLDPCSRVGDAPDASAGDEIEDVLRFEALLAEPPTIENLGFDRSSP